MSTLMYANSDSLNLSVLYQGDIVKKFPFFVMSGVESELDLLEEGTEREVLVKAILSDVIILSQSCDIQRRQYVIVAPILKVKDLEGNETLKHDEIAAIRNRKINYWFYLPELPGILDESVCNLQTIYYISRSLLENHRNSKCVSLSDWGRHHLGWALSNYFGRPIADKSL